MFKDYERCVLEDYRKKKTAGRLTLNLDLSTPAKIRNECVAICDTRFLKKDEKFLGEFFGPRSDANEYRAAIRRYDTDRFKPLCNFLRQKVNSTEEKNIELLAWLIGFPARPYRAGWTMPEAADDPKGLDGTGDGVKEPDRTGDSKKDGGGPGVIGLQISFGREGTSSSPGLLYFSWTGGSPFIIKIKKPECLTGRKIWEAAVIRRPEAVRFSVPRSGISQPPVLPVVIRGHVFHDDSKVKQQTVLLLREPVIV